MSVLKKRALGDSQNELVPSRGGRALGAVRINEDTALRTSAVWAALRLRADLISTMPLDVYRKLSGLSVEVPTPPVLVSPGGDDMDIQTWLWASQFDLDRVGNCYGIISEIDGGGNPRRIDLVDHNTVTVVVSKKDGAVSYRIGGQPYAAKEVWHERQFRIPGMVMGLSPVAYAAWDIAQNQSATDFGLEWFSNGAQLPSGVLKNTAKELQLPEARAMKDRFKQAMQSRDIFVTGSDWEFVTQSVQQNESQFLETQHATEAAISRYFGVPGDLIDIQAGTKSAVTYANITQRNLQFLIMNLGPVFSRREAALSRMLPAPRFVKFNTNALLRMDPDTRNTMMIAQVNAKIRTVTEVRALDDLPAFTPDQYAELEQMSDLLAPEPAPSTNPTAAPALEGVEA